MLEYQRLITVETVRILLTVPLRWVYLSLMKNTHAQALGKLGGLARAKVMSAEKRIQASRKANLAKKRKRRQQAKEGTV